MPYWSMVSTPARAARRLMPMRGMPATEMMMSAWTTRPRSRTRSRRSTRVAPQGAPGPRPVLVVDKAIDRPGPGEADLHLFPLLDPFQFLLQGGCPVLGNQAGQVHEGQQTGASFSGAFHPQGVHQSLEAPAKFLAALLCHSLQFSILSAFQGQAAEIGPARGPLAGGAGDNRRAIFLYRPNPRLGLPEDLDAILCLAPHPGELALEV